MKISLRIFTLVGNKLSIIITPHVAISQEFYIQVSSFITHTIIQKFYFALSDTFHIYISIILVCETFTLLISIRYNIIFDKEKFTYSLINHKKKNYLYYHIFYALNN